MLKCHFLSCRPGMFLFSTNLVVTFSTRMEITLSHQEYRRRHRRLLAWKGLRRFTDVGNRIED